MVKCETKGEGDMDKEHRSTVKSNPSLGIWCSHHMGCGKQLQYSKRKAQPFIDAVQLKPFRVDIKEAVNNIRHFHLHLMHNFEI